MPKILRVFNRFIIGGPVINAIILSKYLEPEFETRLVTGPAGNGEQTAHKLIDKYGVEPEFIPQMKRSILPTQDVQAYRAITKIIKEYKPDIVHTHAAKAGAVGRLAAYNNKVPIILHTFHGHTFHSYFNKYITKTFIEVERFLAKRSTKIIAISQMQKDELANEFKICPAAEIEVIPNGIDLSPFSSDIELKREKWRKEFNVPSDAILVGIVGRMAPVKNHTMFVNIVEEVLKHTNDERLHFVIVGDGETRPETEEQLKAKKIPFNYFPVDKELKKVLFTSWQTKMDEVLAGLDIACLTSLNEGTPISVIEAQAASLPVISTNVGAVADTLAPENHVDLIENFSVTEFAKRILYYLQNEGARERAGAAGKAFVYKTYSHLRLVEDMRNLYNRLLAERG